ncbi:MAG TPA: acylneuraminate cytidylyltransferase family protein [Flavobacterium sp.]|jgi:N-acylneuraminate cytidylyltransferase
MSRTIAVIPARGGSKRLPGKNILPLCGLPLLVHSILYAKANENVIDQVYVSTDDPEIAGVARTNGALVVDRPGNISGDMEPTVSAIKHVLQNLEHVENVVLLQPTNPLRPAQMFREGFSQFMTGNFDSLFTVSRNHHKLGRITNNKFVPFNYVPGQRSQDLEPLYFENGLLYITKARLILEDKIVGENHLPMIINHPFANVDIDTLEDFEYASYLMKTNKELL